MSDDNTNKIHPILIVTLDQIDVDEELNVRKTYDAQAVADLKADIVRQGLLNPLVVVRHPNPRKVKEGLLYQLVSGFTRVRALQEMQEEHRKAKTGKIIEAQAKILEFGDNVKDPIAEAYFANLIENTMRRDVKPFEIAKRCVYMINECGVTRGELVRRLGMEKGYINNLIRLAQSLHPAIFEAWEQGHGLAKTDKLLKLCPKDQDEQMELWEKWNNPDPEPEEEEIEASDDEDDEGDDGESRNVRARPKPVVLDSAIEAVRAADVSDDAKKLAVAALRFAAGHAPTIPGIYNPRKPNKPPAKAPRKASNGKRGKGDAEEETMAEA